MVPHTPSTVVALSFLLAACAGSSDAPPPTEPAPNPEQAAPSTPPPATEAAPVARPLVDDRAETPCSGRTPFFRCPVADGKVVELCGDEDGSALQYRFGPANAPELVLPTAPDAGAFAGGEESWVRAMAEFVAVSNDGYRYTLVDKSGGGGRGEGELNNFIGIRVDQGAEEVARIACTGDSQAWTRRLGDLIPSLQAIGYAN